MVAARERGPRRRPPAARGDGALRARAIRHRCGGAAGARPPPRERGLSRRRSRRRKSLCLWGVECFGVTPDVLVTGKGLSGGLYPISATMLAPRAARWLEEEGWGHVSTFGGAEIGCRVAQKVLEITTRRGVLDGVRALSDRLATGLEALRARYPDWLVEIRRQGLVMGLRFAHEHGGQLMTRAASSRPCSSSRPACSSTRRRATRPSTASRTACDGAGRSSGAEHRDPRRPRSPSRPIRWWSRPSTSPSGSLDRPKRKVVRPGSKGRRT
jgi:hypothetical protein